jgi:hypothetical protein
VCKREERRGETPAALLRPGLSGCREKKKERGIHINTKKKYGKKKKKKRMKEAL